MKITYVFLLNQVHIDSEARVADHCSVYALSDPSESAFKQRCDHEHNELCDQCQALNCPLQEVGEAAQDAEFRNEDEREKFSFCMSRQSDLFRHGKPTSYGQYSRINRGWMFFNCWTTTPC